MGFVGKVFLIGGTLGLSFVASTLVGMYEESTVINERKKVIKYIESSDIKRLIASVDDDYYRSELNERLSKVCYNFCVYYEFGKSKLYTDEIDAILHDIDIYKKGKKINLVF